MKMNKTVSNIEDYKQTIINLVKDTNNLDILQSVYTMITVYNKLQESNLNYTPLS